MEPIKVGELLPGSVFKTSDESNQFLVIDKDTAYCFMFHYDSHEMTAAVNTTTGKIISIANSRDVIPLIIKRRNDIRNLELSESCEVYSKADLYTLFKINEKVSDFVLDDIFKNVSEDNPIVVRLCNQNKTFIVSQYRTPEHRIVYEVQRVRINEIISE